MATKMLESSAVSAFCESVAVMHSAGIQMDEAVYLLGDNMEDAAFKRACDDVYKELITGKPLARAMQDSGCFPSHVVDMVGAGEHAGRLENVLWSLSKYYDEEDRLYAKIKNAIAYPAALLCVMSVILLFTVIVILPVFVDVYQGLSGDLTAGSFAYVNASIVIGWIALGVTLLCTLLVLVGVLASRTPNGRQRLVRLFEKMPLTRGPLRQMAISRFTAALATFVAAGVNTDIAMEKAVAMVDHAGLKSLLDQARDEMIDPTKGKSLAQAIFDNNVFEPMYARMLVVGTRSGSMETVLASLSDTFFDDSIARIDGLIDSVEPTLAAFLTVSVGAHRRHAPARGHHGIDRLAYVPRAHQTGDQEAHVQAHGGIVRHRACRGAHLARFERHRRFPARAGRAFGAQRHPEQREAMLRHRGGLPFVARVPRGELRPGCEPRRLRDHLRGVRR